MTTLKPAEGTAATAAGPPMIVLLALILVAAVANLNLAVDVTLHGHSMFRAKLKNTGPDNDFWLDAKAAVRDIGRVLDLGYMFTDGIAKLIPFKPGKHVTIADAMKEEPALQARRSRARW